MTQGSTLLPCSWWWQNMKFCCLQIAGNTLTGNAISGGVGSIGIDFATGK